MKSNNVGLTLKVLIRKVEEHLPNGEFCQPYTINYLRNTNRLLLLHRATGKGDVTIFHPDTVKVVLDYLNRRSVNNHEN